MPEISLSPDATFKAAPKITVAMPVLNGGRYLRLAVMSIVRQTFRDWELLIIDDGSTDGALQNLSDIDDRRIRILRDGRNVGLAARLNEAIDRARGEYFVRMDHDDVSYPERFANQLALFERKPDLDLIAVRAVTISDDNELTGALPGPLTHGAICATPWLGFYFPHPTWMGRTAWFRTHRYASPGPYFCEDQELLLRSYATSRFATVDRVLFAYRIRRKINWKKQMKTRWTLFNIQLRHFLSSGQLHFALLAVAGFGGRFSSDMLRLARQTLVGEQYPRAAANSTDSSKWQEVLRETLGSD